MTELEIILRMHTVISEPRSWPLECGLRFPDMLQGILPCKTQSLPLDTFTSYAR